MASKTETHQRAYDTSHKTKGDLEALQKEVGLPCKHTIQPPPGPSMLVANH